MLQIPLIPTAVTGALLLGAWWGRGRTGDIYVTEDEAKKVYQELCESISTADTVTVQDLAVLAGESIAPEMHWPPRFLATREHKSAWAQLLGWATAQQEIATAEGKSLCDVIKPGADFSGLKIKAVKVPKATGFIPFSTGLAQNDPVPFGPGSNIADSPTPGKWSKQVPNLGLLSSAGIAYGLPSGAARLAASKKVNEHPLNKAHSDYRPPGNNFEQTHYPIAILKFDNAQPIYFPPASEL
jgi:hypothetical protein